ncbi:MAG: hypothetical protein HY704_05445 [Gemmatimonadetes bacterium]|nr:hypothetical protein [Gemmatimonadota bacterium]
MQERIDNEAQPVPAPPIHLYTPEALAACEKALRTVVSRIGAWGPRLILFGGLAPRYIVERVPEEIEVHTGTTDLDVVIGVAIDADDEAVYTKLQQELRNAGFSPSEEGSYAWSRRVDGIRVVIEFFCPVEAGGRPGRLKRNPGGAAGSDLSAIQLKGAELASQDCSRWEIEGEILDHGGRRRVEIQVVNILPFLVLKAFALETRDKEKDAYDIVWTLNAFGDAGPVSAAEAAAGSPIAGSDHVRDAVALLADRFGRLEDQGPSNYARFFLGAAGSEEDRTGLRRFARGVVQEFLRRWVELRP